MKFCMGCMAQLEDSVTVCPHCGYVENTPPANPLQMEPGTILADRYIIGRSLGSGGFGVTYIGWDALLETKVAIKEYLPSEFSTRAYGNPEVTVFEGARQEQFGSGMTRFVDEAKRLAKFSHVDGIVHVFDSIEVNNTAYIIMELLDGETLAQRLERENTISPDETVKMMLPMMKSLDEVHQAGIIHRDIAPDNIFITNGGKIKLIDFGAARFATTSHSRSLSVLVKPGFSPEEQYESRGEQGPHTDVYSLAATMYRMITGKCPPTSIERMARVRNHKKDPLAPVSKYAPDIDDNYETAIMNALNVRVGDRTEDMEKFEQELTSETKVKRRASNISKIINLRWPLWAKIAVPAAAAALVAFGVLFGTGVIGFKANLKKDIVIPEGQTRVPTVINEEYNAGKEKLEKVNLLMEIREKKDSDLVAENLILAQEVNGGAVVQENMLIGVTVSAGVTKQLVPDVAGMELSEAKTQLEGLGFVVETVEQFDDTIAEGCIISQSLTANEEVRTGSKIVLTVSKGRDASAQVKDVKVPNFVGMSYADAIKSAQKLGLSIKVTAEKYSKDYDKNIVMEQAVKANTTIKNTKTVGIVLSLGYEKVEVPDVTLMTEDKATKQLEARGLKANITYQNDETVAAGLVISQNPNTKTEVDTESTVDLVVSKGAAAFAMPDVLGMDEAQAKETLGAKGLAVAVNYEQNDSETEGTVISQSVSAGADVSRGASVTITVCTHSQTISVPYVVGETQSDAENAISAAGLKPNVVTSYSYAVAKGIVISQTPAGGSGLHEGDMVTISVSMGPEDNGNDVQPPPSEPETSPDDPPENNAAISVCLDETSLTLIQGNTQTVGYVTDTEGDVSDITSEWVSSNTSVATVDGDGKVMAKAAGTANITLTMTGKTSSGGYVTDSAVCTVTVKRAAVSSSSSTTPTEQPTGTVTILGEEYDIATTTRLDFNFKEIGDEKLKQIAPKIEELVNLTDLDLGNNQISDITPLANLTNLTILNFYDNEINDITPLENLTNLTELCLRRNQISDISPLAKLTNLTSVELEWNQITDITPLSNLTNLTNLGLGENQISDITPLAKLTNLTYLDLSENQISDITPLAKLTNLTDLSLSENQISDITPLANLTDLTELWLYDNQISDITQLAKLTNLTVLHLYENQISDITPLAKLTNLTHLDLGYNQISDITPLAKLTNLTGLYLYGNQISEEDQTWLKQQLPNCDISF